MKSLFYTTLTCCLYACAAEVSSDFDESADFPEGVESVEGDDLPADVAATSQAIRNGIDVPGRYGVVRIEPMYCTGVLINDTWLLTAAHCLWGRLSNGRTGTFRGTITYFDPEAAGTRAITNSNEYLIGYIKESWQHDELDPSSDLAMVARIQGPWIGTNTMDYLRISTGTCAQIDRNDLFGQGYNAFAGTGLGELRRMPVNLHECHKYYFFGLAGARQACKGDSGGPYILHTPSFHSVIAGIHNNSKKPTGGSGLCTEGGGEEYGARLANQIGWIESKLGTNCAAFLDGDHPYRRCW